MPAPVTFYVKLFCALAYGGLCAYGGYVLRDSAEQPEVIEPAPELHQADGSVVLERDSKPASEPAPHALPAGSVEERRVSVRVQPDAAPVPANADACECKPVRVDLSLVRDTAGGRRVIASALDGHVLGGLDVPITPRPLVATRPWAAGVGYDLLNDAIGVRIDRDFAHNARFLPNRVSVDAMVGDFDGDGRRDETAIRAWAMWRFGD